MADIIARGMAAKAFEEAASKASLVDGKVPSEQLPSYVDDVIEYNSINEFPETGEQGKIYIALDTNFTYRWSGSLYLRIGGPDLTELLENFADIYDNNNTYAVDDLVVYDMSLYRCITSIEQPESWTADHWELVTVEELLGEKLDIDKLVEIFGGDFYYTNGLTFGEYSNWTCSVTGYTGTETEITIPKKIIYSGACFTVTKIGNNFIKNNTVVTKVNIPDTVIEIGDYAFSHSHLETISVPSSVKKIGQYAFDHTTYLTSITLAEGLEIMGQYAFAYAAKPGSGGTYGTTTITLPSTIRQYGACCFYYSKFNQITVLSNAPISSEMFEHAKFSGVLIQGAVTSIGDYAFRYTETGSIGLPKTIKSLGSYCFANSRVLSGSSASQQRPLTFPDIESLGTECFYMAAVFYLQFGDRLTQIPSSCFSQSSIKEITLGLQANLIQSDAFSYCTQNVIIDVHRDVRLHNQYISGAPWGLPSSQTMTVNYLYQEVTQSQRTSWTNKQNAINTTNVPSGNINEYIGLDTNGNLVRGAVGLAAGVQYLTTAPTEDNTDGLKFVVLSAEPATKYNGYFYIITESE